MTAYLPPPHASAYRLTEELCEPMGFASVRRVPMDEFAVEQSLLTKLGARGWGRVLYFRNHYNQPWGQRRGTPLSPRALNEFSRFVAEAIFPAGSQPSVFLTDQGGLELCWEDAESKARQIEFKPDGLDYFIEATGEEGSTDFSRMMDVVRKLTRT